MKGIQAAGLSACENGSVYADGDSSYTVISEVYEDRADCSEASSVTTWTAAYQYTEES